MGQEIAGYSGGAAVRTSSRHTGAASTAGVRFEGTVHGWTDLPLRSRETDPAHGDLLVEAVESMTGFARVLDGVPHQTRIGWRAYADRIHVVRAARPLVRRGDGALVPDGSWRHLDATTRASLGTPRRTRGTVPLPTGTGADVAATDEPALPRDQQAAAGAFTYLPPQVRTSTVRAVPHPTQWWGSIVRYARGGWPSSETVRMLRLDGDAAVVLEATRSIDVSERLADEHAATRHLAALPWDVTQLVYRLAPAQEHRGTGRSRRLGSR